MAVFITGGQAAGRYDENTVLLLHGEDLTDSSMYGNTITNHGVTVSAAQSKFGGKSLCFQFNATTGTGVYLTIPGDIFKFGTGEFTVECWVRPDIAPTDNFFFSGGNAGALFFGRQNNMAIGLGRAGVAWDSAFSKTLPQDEWSHVAVCRKSGTVYFFVNGTLAGSGANAHDYNMQGGLAYVGSQGSNYFYRGYIDELRVSNVARWTSNFTPPTEAYKG